MIPYAFGPHRIRPSEVFFTSPLSLGIVNLKPISPGHSLLIPRRNVPRFADLNNEEVADLFISAKRVGQVLEERYAGEALTMVVQDGKAAGQSVPHVHVHLIPRRAGDWANNDDIYVALDKTKRSITGKIKHAGVDNEKRKARSLDEMAAEASQLRLSFPECIFD